MAPGSGMALDAILALATALGFKAPSTSRTGA
jgi:hypothetical protein